MAEQGRGTPLTRRRVLAGAGVGALVAAGAVAWTFRPTPVDDRSGWREGAPLPDARGETKAAVLGGRIYVPGGMHGAGQSTAETVVLGPESDWEQVAPMPRPLNHHATAALDGLLYVVGGARSYGDPPERHVFVYDPSAEEWTGGPPLPEGRMGHELVTLDGRLYLVGGETTDSHDTLVLEGGTWKRAAPVPTPRHHLAAAAVDGTVLAVGGRHDGENLATVERYDPSADAWESLEATPTARSGAVGVALDGRFHLIGGEDPSPVEGWTTDRHEVYDGEGWREAAPLPLELHGAPGAVRDGQIYVVGGAWRPGALSVTAWNDGVFVYGA